MVSLLIASDLEHIQPPDTHTDNIRTYGIVIHWRSPYFCVESCNIRGYYAGNHPGVGIVQGYCTLHAGKITLFYYRFKYEISHLTWIYRSE